MKRTILITGGAGYIGSHAVVAFEQAGFKTVTVDNLSNSSIKSLIGIEKILGYKPDFFEVDLRKVCHPELDSGSLKKENTFYDSEINSEGQYKTNYVDGKLIEGDFSLEDIFQRYSFDGVIHFAGLKAVGESCSKPLEYHDNNIVGSIRLFELMEKYNVKNIIFSSSATVYKEIKEERLKTKDGYTETDLVGDCSNPYGTTKFILEQILRDLAIHANFNVMNLRYFNPIGAHETGYIGEDPNGIPNNLLPYIMKVAVGELPYLNIFGNDYNTIDGTGVRDYIDVNDLVEGHIKAYKKLELNSCHPGEPLVLALDTWINSGSKKVKNNFYDSGTSPEGHKSKGFFETYNLGTGKGVSVLEMLNSSKNITGIDIPYKIVGRRDGDLAEVYCNPKKAYDELGFKTKISLEESLENSWKFYNRMQNREYRI